MRKRFCTLLATLGVAVIVGVAWLVVRTPAEPVYQGKRLRVWLQNYAGTRQARQEADAAVRQIGTNAIPTLLGMLHAYDAPLKIKLLTWASSHRILGFRYTNPSVFNEQAFMGFQALGPDAACAVPKLIKLLDQNVSGSSKIYTTRTLAVIGPEAKEAVPLLLRIATSTNVSDHSDAIWALGQIHAEPDKVVPVLIRALSNPSQEDQLFAAIALGKFRGDAKPAVPALLEALKSAKVTLTGSGRTNVTLIGSGRTNITHLLWQTDFRRHVEQDLQQIDPETYVRVVTNASQTQSNSLDFFTVPNGPF
ncbi:HEAT repeat domain-containing protein [Pedosphaera parvula]|uniref:PBS lyase HEAT domain protein repeat-containing protein n=1 Tax=Pedosphaera parvula (strain Ellin514) TaxID=320771 RepID=B9XG08_PEDPL|nr:HEAT repeat domain-containing protein [Pedosphaera parvula]EEF61170.1 PBS lyase HEAT domain protein repeat-containing protein [Pedosphaera parvula Ellin514]